MLVPRPRLLVLALAALPFAGAVVACEGGLPAESEGGIPDATSDGAGDVWAGDVRAPDAGADGPALIEAATDAAPDGGPGDASLDGDAGVCTPGSTSSCPQPTPDCVVAWDGGPPSNVCVCAGRMQGGACLDPVLLVPDPQACGGIAVDSTSVYWVDCGTYTCADGGPPPCAYNGDGALRKMPLAGGPPTTLASGLALPGFLSIDSTYAYVLLEQCAADAGACPLGVVRIPLAGGAPVLIAPSSSKPVAVDGTSVYEMSPDWNVMKVALDGGASAPLAVRPDFTADDTSVYGTSWGSDGGLIRSPLDGGPAVTLVAFQGDSKGGLAVDPSAVYWTLAPYTNAAVTSLEATPLNGGPTVTLATGAWMGAMTRDSTNLYYSGDRGIMKQPVDGGAPTTAVAWTGEVYQLAYDATNLYWTGNGSSKDKGGVWKIAKP